MSPNCVAVQGRTRGSGEGVGRRAHLWRGHCTKCYGLAGGLHRSQRRHALCAAQRGPLRSFVADCRYVGEWFEAKAEPGHTVPPLEEQREHAVHNLWVATGIYGAFAVVSGIAVCVHYLRGRL